MTSPTEWVSRGETTRILHTFTRYGGHDLTDMAEESGVPVSVLEMILDGRIDPVHRLMHDRIVEAKHRLRPLERITLPAEPLLTMLDGRELDATQRRAVERARRRGVVTLGTADNLSVTVLGLTPELVYGEVAA